MPDPLEINFDRSLDNLLKSIQSNDTQQAVDAVKKAMNLWLLGAIRKKEEARRKAYKGLSMETEPNNTLSPAMKLFREAAVLCGIPDWQSGLKRSKQNKRTFFMKKGKVVGTESNKTVTLFLSCGDRLLGVTFAKNKWFYCGKKTVCHDVVALFEPSDAATHLYCRSPLILTYNTTQRIRKNRGPLGDFENCSFFKPFGLNKDNVFSKDILYSEHNPYYLPVGKVKKIADHGDSLSRQMIKNLMKVHQNKTAPADAAILKEAYKRNVAPHSPLYKKYFRAKTPEEHCPKSILSSRMRPS